MIQLICTGYILVSFFTLVHGGSQDYTPGMRIQHVFEIETITVAGDGNIYQPFFTGVYGPAGIKEKWGYISSVEDILATTCFRGLVGFVGGPTEQAVQIVLDACLSLDPTCVHRTTCDLQTKDLHNQAILNAQKLKVDKQSLADIDACDISMQDIRGFGNDSVFLDSFFPSIVAPPLYQPLIDAIVKTHDLDKLSATVAACKQVAYDKAIQAQRAHKDLQLHEVPILVKNACRISVKKGICSGFNYIEPEDF